MQGDYFSHTVTLLIEHNDQGAFGLVVNMPLDTLLSELLVEQGIPFDQHLHDSIPLMETGPVEQNRLFFLHSSDAHFDNSFTINDEVSLTTSLDLIERLTNENRPKDIMAGLGYAGWSGGQLESELQANIWLVTPYLHEAVFNTLAEERPMLAAKSIGVDLNLIAPTPGHG